MTDVEIQQRIERYLNAKRPGYRDVTAHDDLFDSGVLDSLAFIELIGYLGTEFGVTVSDDDLFSPQLTTAAGLAEFVQSRVGV